MRKIKYKQLIVQNFLSIGNDSVTIDFQNGLNLITGTNIDNPERKNGTGKSAIIESFYYALFGTTIRDIKKEFTINNVTKGAGNITLTFDVTTDTGTSSYKIVRTLKPSTVELYLCGDEDTDITKDTIANTNKYICDLLGTNPVICKSCDILSLSDNVPFMAKKPEEKRKFIEDIFTLEIFGKMMKDLKEKIKENKGEISVTTAKIEEISTSISTLQKQYNEQKQQVEDREELINARRTSLIERIADNESLLGSFYFHDEVKLTEENVKLNKAWTQIDGKLSKLLVDSSITKDSKLILENNLKQFSNISGGICPSCKQNVSDDHLEHIEVEKSQIRETLEGINAELNEFNSERTALEEKKSKVQAKLGSNTDLLNENKESHLKVKNINQSIIDLKVQLGNLNDDSNFGALNLKASETIIEETVTRKTEQEEIFADLKQTSEDLEICKFILGEEGVKSFMIKRLLDMLNTSIQKYINDLGMTMRCKFDEYFDEKITNQSGKNISYWNFSGGERRTVDLACAWAFKDIKRKISGVSSNVEFLDEIFDSAFDERGLDLLIEVLKDRIEKGNLSCYAISHRKETLKHVDGEIVNIEKENGITRRVLT